MLVTDSARTRIFCFVLTVAVLGSWCTSRAFALASGNGGRPSDAPSLQIVVLQGEDGVNIIKNKTAVKPVVEVRDKNKGPGVGVLAGVSGVVVVFLLEGGGSARFANGRKSMSVVTDANGRATAGAIRPLHKGSFNIEVRASYQGQAVSRTITQVNFKTVAAAHKAGRVPGSSHGDPETQTASQTGGQSTGEDASQAASGGGSSTASTAGASTAAAAGGHTALIVGGIAAAGAVAGGVAYAESQNSNQQRNCTSLNNQVGSDLQNEVNVCSAQPGSQACLSAAQTVIDDAGQLCSCEGGPGAVSPQFIQAVQQLVQALGLIFPSSCQ